MDNPEKLAIYGTPKYEDKQNKNPLLRVGHHCMAYKHK
jgi:hypothetical protein